MSIPRIQSYAMPTQWPQARPAWKIEAARSVLLVHDMQQYFVDFFDVVCTQDVVHAGAKQQSKDSQG